MREKLIDLLCKAHSKAIDEILSDDISYAQQLEIEADHLIQNGVTFQKWVPVSERLPEQGQEVIIYTGNILKPTVLAYQFWNPKYDTWAHVTHWMPLPEPPK